MWTVPLRCFSLSLSVDESCRDLYYNCVVVVQARLCVYSYYRTTCCASCSRVIQRDTLHRIRWSGDQVGSLGCDITTRLSLDWYVLVSHHDIIAHRFSAGSDPEMTAPLCLSLQKTLSIHSLPFFFKTQNENALWAIEYLLQIKTTEPLLLHLSCSVMSKNEQWLIFKWIFIFKC